MNKKTKAIGNLKNIAEQTKVLLESLSGSSEKLSTKNTSTLFGLLGGLMGTGLSVLLDISLNTSLPIEHFLMYSVLTALGTTLGTICYRGTKRIRLEKCMEENKLIYDELLNRIKTLPKNAPEYVKDELWANLVKLQKSQESQIENLLEPQKKSSLFLPHDKDK